MATRGTKNTRRVFLKKVTPKEAARREKAKYMFRNKARARTLSAANDRPVDPVPVLKSASQHNSGWVCKVNADAPDAATVHYGRRPSWVAAAVTRVPTDQWIPKRTGIER